MICSYNDMLLIKIPVSSFSCSKRVYEKRNTSKHFTMINKSIKKLWLCLACMLSVAYVSAQKASLTPPLMASHYGVAIQGACIYSEPWNNLPEGELTPMGIYQMNQTDGYEIKPFLINSAVYSNGGGAFIGDTFWFVWKQRDPTGQITLCQREKFDRVSSSMFQFLVSKTM